MFGFSQSLQFQITDTISDTKQKTINILTLVFTGVGVAALGLTILCDMLGLDVSNYWITNEKAILYISAAILIIVMPGFYWLNQRVSQFSGWLFSLCLLALCIVSDIASHIPHRGLVTFAIPIIVSSSILQPWASFAMAGLSSIVIIIIEMMVLEYPQPNLVAVLLFFVIASVTYLNNANKERAATKAQTKVKEQQQDLLQMVDDFSFILSNQQNAIILFGADGNVMFENKVATRARQAMDAKAHSVFDAVIEKAWKKNVFTRVQYGTHIVEITSSLIEADSGTCLLVQAIRLPDEGSKRSLEEWQQRLEAANHLPVDTEFDARTGKMRMLIRNNGKVSKKILFELASGCLTVENPANREKIQFDLEDLAALAME
ncbi:MAG: hypothetical protein GY832_02515 [Chloroflexi bacterium]|nr:hypothetical protein [Chloroflexota bacterium]